jgi:hypothetical protein
MPPVHRQAERCDTRPGTWRSFAVAPLKSEHDLAGAQGRQGPKNRALDEHLPCGSPKLHRDVIEIRVPTGARFGVLGEDGA